MYLVFLIHTSADGCLGCFHVMAIIESEVNPKSIAVIYVKMCSAYVFLFFLILFYF